MFAAKLNRIAVFRGVIRFEAISFLLISEQGDGLEPYQLELRGIKNYGSVKQEESRGHHERAMDGPRARKKTAPSGDL